MGHTELNQWPPACQAGMDSGATLLAAKNKNKHAIGFEISEKDINLAKSRLGPPPYCINNPSSNQDSYKK